MDIQFNSGIIDPISDTTIIAHLISEDVRSKKKKDMYDGARYYIGEHDIMHRKRTYVHDGVQKEDPTKANNRIPHPFHRILVDQKLGYVFANAVFYTAEDPTLEEKISDVLGMKFDDAMYSWAKEASNKGVGWLHPYINSRGEFKYIIIPSEQCIPIWKGAYQDELQYMIRYYTVENVDTVSGNVVERFKVEFWDEEKVTYYIETDEGYTFDYSEPINPKYHWYTINTLYPDMQYPNSWGRVPFIRLQNNDEETTDLSLIKGLIDDYDRNASDISNALEEIQEVIYILKGYEDEDLGEFLKNLKHFRAIKISGEHGNADVKIERNEIPGTTVENVLQRTKENIYAFGGGIDPTVDKFGSNPSGVALKWLYQNLILKSEILIRKLEDALYEFAWYIVHYINMKENTTYSYKKVKPIINPAILSNDIEVIESLEKSKGTLSEKTILEKHPYVDNVEEEMRRLQEQRGNETMTPSE